MSLDLLKQEATSYETSPQKRFAIAQNPNTERDICQQLTQDPNRIVRAAARDNLKITN